jgi:formamidopyrimidine-DNA glycosylase
LPELPDVEVFRRYLQATSLHEEIVEVELRSPEVLVGASVEDLKAALHGRSFDSTSRHGKHLFVKVTDDGWLMLHFGMTGQLKYFKVMEREPEYDRLLISFANGYHLAYDAMRKLGEVQLVDNVEQFIADRELGPDALSPELGADTFVQRFAGQRGMIKPALMNQKIIAGIGNVYSDEILFQVGIHPRTKVDDLDRKQLKQIYQTMKEVLHTAIENQADPERFPESYMTQHRHKGGRCPVSGEQLQSVKVSGRTAYYCPNRQGNEP